MSSSPKREYKEMLDIAKYLMDYFRDSCHRIEIAGSLRREEKMIGDIELIAVPKFPPNLFGDVDPSGMSMIDADLLRMSWEIIKDGRKYKQFILPDDTIVDLFLQPDPETWGLNYIIRTGPVSFSKWIVTPKLYGGALPWGIIANDARLVNSRTFAAYDTPEEEDVFSVIGIDFIEVADRK